MDRDDLATDPRYLTNTHRIVNRGELSVQIRAILAQRTTAQWQAAFGEAGVPCGPINTLAQVYRNPQVVARKMVFEMQHPLAGPVPLTSNPIRFREAPIRCELPPPLLGQHTREVLTAVLGLSTAQLEELSTAKAI